MKSLYKNSKYLLYVLILSFLFSIFILPVVRINAYEDITPLKLKELIDTSQPIIIMDVRSKEEYNSGHIPTSLNIPVSYLLEDVVKKKLPKSTTIIVYCNNGIRAEEGAKLLDRLGYTNVYNLGSLSKWPYDMEK